MPSPAVDPEAAAVAKPRQRNIVLLSDGTGNAAKLHKTNVWWLYQALDLGADDQIAIYDDGVGTSGFRPLQWLGGASAGACRATCATSTSSCAGIIVRAITSIRSAGAPSPCAPLPA